MDEIGIRLLNLMFRPGEHICPHHKKYAYHSIPLEAASAEKVILVPVDPVRNPEFVLSSDLLLVALNPINGFRNDGNCTAYRNFLVEMDYGPLGAQLQYAKDQIKLPYSAVVFSGSKSLHFLISLDTDLPNEESYRFLAEWTLNVATMADQNTKNPSRSIRIPGAYREPGKLQRLVELKGPTTLTDFRAWLEEHPEAKPKKYEKRAINEEFEYASLKPWVRTILLNGLNPNKSRNGQWFAISCEFAVAGYSEDDTIRILGKHYSPDRDFKEREWLTSIKSGFKHIYSRK